jgi:hypothetical protein
MNLQWWEFEQLLDHLRTRQDIWSSPREGLWLRSHSYDDNTSCLGLAISPPVKTGPFRQYVLRAVPFAWDAAQCDEYLTALVSKWTDYGTRRRYTEFLITEANIAPAVASSIATGLCAVDQGEIPDVEAFPLPSTRELWPDVSDLDITTGYSERALRTYGIVGGGWLTVRLSGGMLHVRASLRSDGRYGGGYGGVFEGFVRPNDGNVPLASAFLFGNDLAASRLSAEQEQLVRNSMRGGDGDVPPDFLAVQHEAEFGDGGRGADEVVPEPEPGTAL